MIPDDSLVWKAMYKATYTIAVFKNHNKEFNYIDYTIRLDENHEILPFSTECLIYHESY
jgi:hypothetical protein